MLSAVALTAKRAMAFRSIRHLKYVAVHGKSLDQGGGNGYRLNHYTGSYFTCSMPEISIVKLPITR